MAAAPEIDNVRAPQGRRTRCFWAGILSSVSALVIAGCTHRPFETAQMHYLTFNVPEPQGSTVHVCHAYGCQRQTRYRFSADDIAKIKSVMRKTRRADTAAEERRAVAYAIGWIERHVGRQIGTDTDRAGMEFSGSGDPGQQDCVDEATNTTSYLTVLENNGLLKYHTVGVPFAKDNLLNGISGWTHWTAVLKDTETNTRWAVDSWIYANGENPAVVETDKWYLSTLNDLPKAMR
ncbi:MAG: hypothetical protein AAFR70_08090 [Pseudomonadota bacterium]